MKLILETWRRYLKEEVGTKNKIFVLVGPPSVGKSHWIGETFEEEPYVISRDDIAKGVAKTYSTPDGTPWTYDDLFVPPSEGAVEGDVDENYGTVAPSPPWMKWQPLSYDKVMEANEKVQELFLQRVSEAVPSGKDIVVDMTNLNADARKGALKAIEGAEENYEKVAVVFNFEGAEEIIKKLAAKRAEAAEKKGESKTIDDEVFDRMFKAFQQVDPSEGFDEVVSVDSREELERIANEPEPQEKEEKEEALQEFKLYGVEDTYKAGAPQDVFGALEKVLVDWEKMGDLSDEDRWKRYAQDIQRVVDTYKEEEGT